MAPLDEEARRMVICRRKAGLGGHRGQPARRHRRVLRAGDGARPRAPARAALWRSAGHAGAHPA